MRWKMWTSYIRKDAVSRLLRVYREIDKETGRFRKSTRLECPPPCGHCCMNPEIEAYAFEFQPLAEYLWHRGTAEQWLKRIDKAGPSAVCVFFEGKKGAPASGRCGIYPLRALICRMFGFSAVRDKNGKLKFAACSVMKERYPSVVKKAQEMIGAGLDVPVITSCYMKAKCLEPEWGKNYLPINAAIKAAIMKKGLSLHLSRQGKAIRPNREVPVKPAYGSI